MAGLEIQLWKDNVEAGNESSAWTLGRKYHLRQCDRQQWQQNTGNQGVVQLRYGWQPVAKQWCTPDWEGGRQSVHGKAIYGQNEPGEARDHWDIDQTKGEYWEIKRSVQIAG